MACKSHTLQSLLENSAKWHQSGLRRSLNCMAIAQNLLAVSVDVFSPRTKDLVLMMLSQPELLYHKVNANLVEPHSNSDYKCLQKIIFLLKICSVFQDKCVQVDAGSQHRPLHGCRLYQVCKSEPIQQDFDSLMCKQAEMLADQEIYPFLRKPIFNAYCWWCGVNKQEVELPFHQYPTLGDFFTRKVVRQPKQISPNSFVSPSDGVVLAVGQVTQDQCHIIKEAKYSLSQLVMGKHKIEGDITTMLRSKKDSSLYHVVIYLAPKDYHRFHAPCNMTVLARRPIEGGCKRVSEGELMKGEPVYEKNARVVVHGKCDAGKITMVLVGAKNVTRIQVTEEEKLASGQQMGWFNLGSTIVLLVQTDKTSRVTISPGDALKFGDTIMDSIS